MNINRNGSFDLHLHTVYSDGKNTPEEMVLAAIEKGLDTVGFTDHSYTAFDTSYCMPKERIADYLEEISRLKAEYASKIRILCGIEQDLDAAFPAGIYDYRIGSVHYVWAGQEWMPVDHNQRIFTEDVNRCFGGDYIAFAESYYAALARTAEVTGADIIGHFDLVTKFNEGGRLFDETDPRYVRAWQQAADRLLASGALFEINTGAIARGYRTSPYPAPQIREYLAARGARFLLSSDSHNTANIAFRFDEFADLVK